MKSILLISFFALCFISETKALEVKVLSKLYPAGYFELNCSNIIATSVAKKEKNTFIRQAKIEVSCLDSGIALRNEHVHKFLDFKKYPYLLMNDITIGDKEASAKVSIVGKEKNEKISFRKKGDSFILGLKINIEEYGLKSPSYMGVKVDKFVDVTISGKIKELEIAQ